MHLIKKTYQHRRDFAGIFACAHCGNEELIDNCYDDAHFHENVIPGWECKKCKKTGGGIETRPSIPADMVI